MVATRPKRLDFRPVTAADIGLLAPMLKRSGSRSCDLCVGGIFMWVDYFGYEYAMLDDTLFVKGLSEDASRSTSFSLPVGRMPLDKAIRVIRVYCRANGLRPLLSAVPEDRLDELRGFVSSIEELPDWADYIYRIDDLASLSGKRYNKKRNHVNRFMADNPGWSLDPMDADNATEAARVFCGIDIQSEKADPMMAEFEREQSLEVLRDFSRYHFEGAVLRDGNGDIVAFTAAEIAGDTLIVHIEKMLHTVAGAGEAINHLFAKSMLSKHPGLRYVNREDDAGDPGLRYAKESYHPAFKLRKYNVRLYP